MSTQTDSPQIAETGALAELLEALLSAMAGCGLVMLLAFFLSIESWVLNATGLR